MRVLQVIHTKGALGLLAEKVGTGNSNIGTMRGTLRNQMMASATSINISPVPGSRGSVILSPRIGLERCVLPTDFVVQSVCARTLTNQRACWLCN